MRYLFRRALHASLLLAGVSLLSFALMQLAPGEFFSDLKLDPRISSETLQALRAQYALDRPLPVRYARWLRSTLEGDLGFSFAYNMPVSRLLAPRARNTLLLTVSATLFAWMMAIPLGVLAAARRRRWVDHVLSSASSGLLAVPELLLALLLLMLAVRTRALPAGGMVSLNFSDLSLAGKIADLARHLVLPAGAVALGILPILLRHVRAAVAEALDSPFMRAARSHGLSPLRLLFGYALPAAANPLISLFGLSVGALLSGSLLVEVVMSWPGLGPMLLEAILARDLYVVIAAVMISTVFLLAGNLLADALLYVADPRIRRE